MTEQGLKRGYLDTARGQFHYRRQGSGTPMLLLQILPFSNVMFEPLMTIMAKQGFDCIALDLMGYGQSSPRLAPWTVEDHALSLHEAISNLGLRPRAIVSGHFTAMVATEFALRFPEKLDKLVLDGVPLWPREIAEQRLAAMTPPKAWAGDGADLNRLWQSAFGLLRKFDPDLRLTKDNTPRIAELFFGFVRTSLAVGSAEAIFRYDLESRLPLLKTPVLVVGSPTDSLRDRHEKAMSLIPHAQQHLFETVHPLYAIDKPDDAINYADVLKEFIGT